MGFEFVHHQGKRIALVDLVNATPEQALAAFTAARPKIAALPLQSALICTDVTAAHYDQVSSEALRAFAQHNTPHVKASAVVGADGLRAVVLAAVARLTGRNIRACATRAEAFDWLAGQG